MPRFLQWQHDIPDWTERPDISEVTFCSLCVHVPSILSADRGLYLPLWAVPPPSPSCLWTLGERGRIEEKRGRSDPPGGKRWQRSVCSLSAHCPLQLPGPWKQITGFIFKNRFLSGPVKSLWPQMPVVPVTSPMHRSMIGSPCIPASHPHIHHPPRVIKC